MQILLRALALVPLVSLFIACGSETGTPDEPTPDASQETSNDAGSATIDAGKEAVDAGAEEVDAGPAPDTTPPVLVDVKPVNDTTVALHGTVLEYTFDEPIKAQGFSNVPSPQVFFGTPLIDATRTTFRMPIVELQRGTSYVFTINATDVAGNAMAPFEHRLLAEGDGTPPTVLEISPANGATEVTNTTPITITFSEPMDQASTQGALAVTLMPNLPGTRTWSGNALTFTPTEPYAPGSTVSGKLNRFQTRDVASNLLRADVTFSFKVAGVLDTTRPTLASTVPMNTQAGQSQTQPVIWTFSKAMATAATAFAATVEVGGAPVAGSKEWSNDDRTLTFTPAAPYPANTRVDFKVGFGAHDLSGNQLPSQLNLYFTTARETTVELIALSTQDGMVSLGGTATTTGSSLFVGDSRTNDTPHRGFLGFDLTPIDAAANLIVKAELSVYQLGSFVADQPGGPYGADKLGAVHAVSVDFGPALEVADYDGAKLTHAGNDVVLATADENGVVKTIDVTQKVAADWTARSSRGKRCQFRLQFDNPKVVNGKTDGTYFGTAETNGDTGKPRLRITYRQP